MPGGFAMRPLLRPVAFPLLIVACSPGVAFADAFENVPTGSRTAAMGGAGLAGGSDSAMPLMNPAGLALIPHSIASLSASLYQVGVITVPNFMADDDSISSQYGPLAVSQAGVQSAEFGSFPSGIAYFLHLGDSSNPMTLAGSLSVPRVINRRFLLNTEFLGEGVSVKDNLTTFIQEQAYMAAISFAIGFGDLRLGASVLGSYTSFIRATDRSELIVLGTFKFLRTQTKEARNVHSFDIGAIVGAQYDIADWLQVGLGFRSPSLHLKGSFNGSVDHTALDSEGEPFVSTMVTEGDGVRGFPMRLGFGLQLHGQAWSVAIDGTVYLPRAEEYKLEGDQIISDIGGATADRADVERIFKATTPTRAGFNINVGFEYRVTDSNWLRLGVFTEMSAEKKASVRLENFPAGISLPPEELFQFPIDRYGVSAGWGSQLGPIDTTFGARASFGSGETLRTAPNERFTANRNGRAEVTDASAYTILAFISAAIDVTEGAAELLKSAGGSKSSAPGLE